MNNQYSSKFLEIFEPKVHLNIYRVSAKYFFLENALKKTAEYFIKFLFYLKVQSFRLIMEHNFIQMAVSAGHAVA